MTASTKRRDDSTRGLEPALEDLRSAALDRLRAHPEGFLLQDRVETLRLTLDLPLAGELRGATASLSANIERALSEAIAAVASSRPGCVPCRACDSSACEHAISPGARYVHSGYRSNGMPRFEDLGQWLLDRGDSRVDTLYATPPGFIAQPLFEADIYAELARPSRAEKSRSWVRGQVVAGWYNVPALGGGLEKMALTFQLLASGRQTQLHIAGVAPGPRPLADLTAQLTRIPWEEPVRWASSAAQTLGPSRRGSSKNASSQRVEGLLTSLARRLEKQHRGKRRRTHHAEGRHEDGKRPTRMAMTDLARADSDQILFDDRHGTAVVLGERGRAHFFSSAGRIVSSVRYSNDAITRKRDRKIWRPASQEEILRLKSLDSQSNS